jgi:hypothetical protein
MGPDQSSQAETGTILAPGESHEFEVFAREVWNPSGIEMEEGASYRFEVIGYQDWNDWSIETNPDGYSRWWLWPFTWLRRLPDANWFQLVGAIGRSRDGYFKIGKGATERAARSGPLHCFANDVRGMYWNNRGRLTLRVTREARDDR